ncbi:MAG: hypothetical protein K1060chlam1_00432 [Candidatus Anoxychlamydiales bacterium]|nr:hypothetical protein [Candidatus Anoxychlamydiales bacterium]
MSVLSTSSRATLREQRLLADIGETAVHSAIAYFGAKTLTVIAIAPLTAAIFMGSVIAVTKIAQHLFKNSANNSTIISWVFWGTTVVVGLYIGINIIDAILIAAITRVAFECLQYLHRNIL